MVGLVPVLVRSAIIWRWRVKLNFFKERVITMKKKISLMLVVACLVLSQFAHAGTVDVFGYTWDTTEGTYAAGANPEILYTVNNPDSITVTGIWAGWASISMPLSISPGDVLSYDRYLSNDPRDRTGSGSTSTWLNSYQSHPLDTSGVSLDNYFENQGNDRDWPSTTAAGWIGLGGSGSVETGIHYDITFGATSYTLTMTDIVTGDQIETGTAALDPTLIGFWQFGMWESEQDMTIENFAVIPEPATMLLLGLGGVLLRRKRV